MFFYISRILVQESTRAWLLFHALKTIEKCKMLGHISKKGRGLAAELHFYNAQNVFSDLPLR